MSSSPPRIGPPDALLLVCTRLLNGLMKPQQARTGLILDENVLCVVLKSITISHEMCEARDRRHSPTSSPA